MGSVVITNRTVSDPLLSAVTEHQGSSALLSVERNSGSFQLQQLLLGGKTTSEAYQGTIVPNDPMTGDHNRNRIASHCCTHCLAGPRLTDPRGNFTITHRVTIGDLQQLFPDSKLKRGSSQIETQTKTAPVSFEVFSQLFQRLAQQRAPSIPQAAGRNIARTSETRAWKVRLERKFGTIPESFRPPGEPQLESLVSGNRV